MKKYLLSLIICILNVLSFAQARLIINNGGIININGGTVTNPIYLVVDNFNSNAITRNTSGHIISEGEFNILKWNIGSNAASYTLPFGINTTNYLPINFTTSGAVGSGNMQFSTHSGNWQNSNYLPLDVLTFNHNGNPDNSAYTIDRFWRVEPINYITNPTLTNLTLSYLDIEYSQANNSIIENNLIAQRYNNSIDIWDDYFPVGSINTATNTYNITSIAGNQNFRWWTLSDNSNVLPIELASFESECKVDNILITWKTLSEVNNNYFILEKSTDGITFNTIATIPSKNSNSNSIQEYSFLDDDNINTLYYYRLKQTDNDGTFTYSSIIKSNCISSTQEIINIKIFPNPTTDILTIQIDNNKEDIYYNIFDINGKIIIDNNLGKNKKILQNINISSLANATYFIQILSDDEIIKTEKIIKQ
jgi:hypothetical protein